MGKEIEMEKIKEVVEVVLIGLGLFWVWIWFMLQASDLNKVASSWM